MSDKGLFTRIAGKFETLATKSTLFNFFVIINAVKLLFAHSLLDANQIDYFIVIVFIEYLLSSFIYCFLPFLIAGRWLFAFFYLLQVTYLFLTLSYNFTFISNIYVNVTSKLAWEFESLFSSGLTWQTGVALFIAIIDIVYFIKVFRGFSSIKQIVRSDSGLSYKHLFGGVVTLLFVVTSVNSYEFYKSGNNPDTYKQVANNSLHHYGMFASNYLDLYNYKGARESAHKLNYGRNIESRQISGARKESNKTPSFLLIQVESLDAHIVNHQWQGKFVTPFLNSLSKTSVYYPYTLSYHLAGGTSDTEMTIMNNTEPLSDTPTISIYNYSFPNSLPRKFRNNGYKVQAFHGNVGDYYNRDVAYSEMGFSMFYDRTRMRLEQEGWGASDGKVYDFATDRIENSSKPFFSYIISMTSHEPFKNVSNYYKSPNFGDIEPESLRNYFVSVEYVDRMLEKIVKRTRELRPDTYIYIFGDHTPYVLNKVKGPYNIALLSRDDRNLEFVPLFIITPDDRVRQETEKVATFLDIAPTIMQTSNLDYEYRIMGENLLGNIGNDTISFKGKKYDRKELFQQARKTGLGH